MLRAKSGIVYAEALPQRDGDAYSYVIESEVGVDIRKNLFYTLSEKNWPLIGMEALGMSLEDIFIAIVDQSAPKSRYERRTPKSTARQSQADDVAKTLVKNTEKSTDKERYSSLFGEDK